MNRDLPTHERLRRIERRLDDHEAKIEEYDDRFGLTDPGLVELGEDIIEVDASDPEGAVHVRSDISESDGFVDVSEWAPDEEEP